MGSEGRGEGGERGEGVGSQSWSEGRRGGGNGGVSEGRSEGGERGEGVRSEGGSHGVRGGGEEGMGE